MIRNGGGQISDRSSSMVPKGGTAPPSVLRGFSAIRQFANKMTLSVSALLALGAFSAFSCDSDVTPTFLAFARTASIWNQTKSSQENLRSSQRVLISSVRSLITEGINAAYDVSVLRLPSLFESGRSMIHT
jgi:hypothetical protein